MTERDKWRLKNIAKDRLGEEQNENTETNLRYT